MRFRLKLKRVSIQRIAQILVGSILYCSSVIPILEAKSQSLDPFTGPSSCRRDPGFLVGTPMPSFLRKQESSSTLISDLLLPFKYNYRVMKRVLLSSVMKLVRGWGYRRDIRTALKSLKIEADVEIVDGVPGGVEPSKFDKFIFWTKSSNGRLKVFIHKMELERIPKGELKEYLGVVLAHEYFKSIGMSHEEVGNLGFNEENQSKMVPKGLKKISEIFETERSSYLVEEEVLGGKKIYDALRSFMEDGEKKQTILVPSFLLPFVMPGIE